MVLKISYALDLPEQGEVCRVCFFSFPSICVCVLTFFFFFLFFFFKKLRHTFLRNCKAYKAETWYTRGQCVAVSCIPESGC